MQRRPDVRRRAAPSPYAAGVLSLVFPGLGQAYVGAWSRALAWAAPPFLLLALGLGVVMRLNKFELAGLVAQAWFLSAVFVGNLVLLGYRAAAIVDAWRLARTAEDLTAPSRIAGRAEAGAFRGGGLPRGALAGGLLRSLSVAGLAATVLVMAGAHVAVARYDMLVSNLLNCVFDANGTSGCGPTGSPGASGAGGPADTGQPGISLAPEGSALPDSTAPPWTGGRLNFLLVGVDQRPGDQTFNTDTLIVVSIDPATRRVAMFSIPRDTIDIPLPPGPLQQAFGSSVYSAKVNSIWTTLHNRPDLCPGATATARGFNCLKSIIGYFFGLDVKYYAEVNFTGFTQVVDAFGGVTINVQSPVVDNLYPTDGNGDRRIYIPTGLQHMSGSQALIYARSRHGSNDFDRGARQQRVLTSLLAEANIPAILAHLDQLVSAFAQTVHTDIPRELLPQLLGLASQVDTKTIHSFVFAPPLFETEDYVPGVHDFIYPKVSLIRDAVQLAISADPSFEIEREKVAQEGAVVWVLNGSGRPGQAADAAGYLTYQGFAATAPTQPAAIVPAAQIVAYNGAASSFPVSIARLEAIFGVTVVSKTDPTVTADIVVTLGRATPDLTAPLLP
jgi:LCP family protein required for cell wall assembly